MTANRITLLSRLATPAILLLILAIPGPALAQAWVQTNGPYGGSIFGLGINSSGDIFARTEIDGVFRSTNNGATWTKVTTMEIDPLAFNSADHIFVGTNSDGVFRSTDNGDTWTQTGHPAYGLISMAINASNHIFVGNYYGGVYRSTDDGSTWTQINNGLTATEVNALAVNLTSGVIFAGTSDNGIFRSSNNGDNWTQVNNGLTDNFAEALAINSSGHIFAGTRNGGVYRSTNNGDTWSSLGLPSGYFWSLTINAAGHIFAGNTNYGVHRSTDNGDTWTQVINGLTNTYVWSLAVNISTGDVFAGTYGGVFRSTDNGDNWSETNEGLLNTDVKSLVVNASDHVFAGINGGGAFRTTDGGNTWTLTGLRNCGVPALAVNSSGHVFAGSGCAFFRSTDNGDNWPSVGTGLSSGAHSAIAINSADVIFVGTNYGGVFRSTDNGDNFTAVNNGLSTGHIDALAINSANHIFAGSAADGVYRSTDNGDTWTQINNGLTQLSILGLGINASDHIFAATAAGVCRSTDNGDTWTPASSGLPYYGYGFAFNSTGSIFFFSYEGVYRSDDNGDTWQPRVSGLTNKWVWAIAVNSADVMFAGTHGGGVFRSTKDSESSACCLKDGSCLSVNNEEECIEMAGTDLHKFLPGVSCTPNPCRCMRSPKGLIAWWPLDETGPPKAGDVAGLYDAQHLNNPGFASGKVNGAFRNNWSSTNFGIARVSDNPFKQIEDGDFTIDAWVYPEALPMIGSTPASYSRDRMIVCSHYESGIRFFVRTDPATGLGQLGLNMYVQSQTPYTYLTATTPVVPYQWNHVAVTVSRTLEIGKFYHNGTHVGPTFTPRPESMYDAYGYGLDIGHSDLVNTGSCGWTDRYFSGLIDELQIFDRALDETEIYDLWEWDALGKCRDYCHLPRIVSLCADHIYAATTLTICNESNNEADYTWSIDGLSIKPGCPVDGQGMIFYPSSSSGSITIIGRACKKIKITMYPPPGFTVGDFACYAVTVTNTDTQEEFGCQGTIHRSSKYCMIPWQYTKMYSPKFAFQVDSFGVVDMYEGDTAEISFIVVNIEDSSGVFDYEFAAMSSCDCSSADSIISLDGLPPGENITGSVSIPLGDSTTISVSAALVKFEPFNFQDIVVFSDWEGDGSSDPGASVAIHPITFPDCNGNGIHDSLDIAGETSADTNSNTIPDECEYYEETHPYCYGGLGEAVVTYDPSDSSLTVSNIGTTGEDGVSIYLENAQRCDLEWNDLDPGETLPEGAYITVGALAIIDEWGILPTGTGLAEKGSSGWEIFADFSEIGATTQTVEVRLGDSVVATVTGHTGPAATAEASPDGWGVEIHAAMTSMWRNPTEITIISPKSSKSVTGDALHITAEDDTLEIDSISYIEIKAAYIPEITITEVSTLSPCDCSPGNANADETINLLDITYLISYLYKDGAAPIPYEICSGDPNGDCTVNLLDITYLIAFLYKDGSPPCTCEEWMGSCGPLVN